jgi:hypothetical protein
VTGGRRRLVAAVVTGPLALPAPAAACAVCFVGSADSIPAFVGTAIVLSLLPLALIGGLGLWLHRRWRAHHAGAAAGPAP